MAATKSRSMFEPAIVRRALVESVWKLNPRTLMRNPVMFVVEVGAVFTTFVFVRDLGSSTSKENVFAGLVSLFLWFTVLFANFAEAVAEGRGKAQADTLRKTRQETVARRRLGDGALEEVAGGLLQVDDVVVVEAGEIIPSDGEVVEGIASVDESAITGESAPVIREAGGDRSAVTGGTRVLSDEIAVRITARPGETFIDRMIALVEGTSRQKTPNEIALNILLAGLTFIFLLATVTLQPFADFANAEQSVIVLVALLVCLIPTTIGGLLSAIGIAGMDRLVQRNVLAMSGRAVEAAGDCATLLLDKTGTITFGARQADAFVAASGVDEQELADAAQLSSLADETPEGRSIVVLAKERYNIRERELHGATLVAFTAQTRMSGVDLQDGRVVRKGAAEAVRRWVEDGGGSVPDDVGEAVDAISGQGGTPLVVAEARDGGGGPPTSPRVLGVVYLKDIVKPGIAERNNVIALVVFVVIGAVVGTLVSRMERRKAEALRAQANAETLAQLGATLLSDPDPLPGLMRGLRASFGCVSAAVLRDARGTWEIESSAGEPVPQRPEDADVTVPLDEQHVLALTGVDDADVELLRSFTGQLALVVERRRLRAEAAAAEGLQEANALRTALLAAVSHDLRTPLAGIKAAATSLLQRDIELGPDERTELLEAIDEEADRLTSLVGNLLDMSRLQTGGVELVLREVGLDEIVPAALHGLTAVRPENVIVDVPETLPPFRVDAALLERAVANLVANAMHASPPGTPVWIMGGTVLDQVELRIVDQGAGIPPGQRERVFQPFQRLGDRPNGSGVGLGLAVAKGFVDLMGGELTVEDTPGGGTTMVVRFPSCAHDTAGHEVLA